MVESGAERGRDGDGSADEPQAIATTHESGPGDGGSPDADLDILAVGATVGRYLVVERIGAGAMGVVYAAYDPKLDRKIALKLLRPQQGKGDQARRTARLEREAQAIAKLSHPNVVGIFDVGVHEGQVFMAMEYLAGGTLRDWLAAKKRTWREVLKMFIEVGHGLSGAHAEGLIHRDFKPDNVLLDKNCVPKVVDFGLVRLTGTAVETTASGRIDREGASEGEVESAPAAAPLAKAPATGSAALTRTGALTGTPAYMAPEQFLGKAIDARTDQFAFCVALYEALYGERPFAGETVTGLADAVTNGRVREAPRGSEVPGWLRRPVLQGLSSDSARRYESMEGFLAVLRVDPVARRRRVALVGMVSALALLGMAAARNYLLLKRRDIERQIAGYVSSANSSLAIASGKRTAAKALREQSFEAFDHFQGARAEELWSRSLDDGKIADDASERGLLALEAAATLSPTSSLKDRIADSLVEYLSVERRGGTERQEGLKRLASYDESGDRLRRLNAPALVHLRTVPAGLEGHLEKYDSSTFRTVEPPRSIGRTPFDVQLGPGSYRVSFKETATTVAFKYPVLLGPGEVFSTALQVPARSTVPEGFLFIPQGRFQFGAVNEELRTAFLETVPLHAVSTGAFLISKYETTIGEWIEFLMSLPTADRAKRRPQGRKDALGGFIDVNQTSPVGKWEIAFRATNKTYRFREGQPFKYDDRTRLVSQDWLRFPVSGISPEDAIEYSKWLDRSGKVPAARLCTELEWERVARGADAREFPHGNTLLPGDADFDLTYGRKNGAYGPDEVGSHPASVSPFGGYDLAGNVWDIARSALDEGQFVARGGSFYQYRKAALSTNRDPISSVTRDHTLGLRICADVRL
jgi:serine/threonine protein kinase/formylglycine-generating enzyme required for sulfatase activity